MQTCTIPMAELSRILLLQLEKGGKTSLTVTGCSMLPLLHHGRDRVELVTPGQRQQAGDIVLYRRKNGQYVLHRIIAVTENGYLCCGDNQVEKEPVAHSQLLAVTSGIIRKGKPCDIQSLGYRVYTWSMVSLFPGKRIYIGIRRRLGRLKRRIWH